MIAPSLWESLAPGLALTGLLPLPIRVERMRTRAQFLEVAALRRAAYARHYPSFVQADVPDAWDTCPSAVVLMAHRTRDGALLGTMRIRHSLGGREAGAFDHEGFPDWLFAQGSFMTVERFALRAASAMDRRLLGFTLFAAVHAMGLDAGVDYVNGYTVGALMRIYRGIGMSEPREAPVVLCNALTNGVPQTLVQVPTREIPRRSRVPFSRYLLWRLARGIDRKQLLAQNLGGPAFEAFDREPRGRAVAATVAPQP